MRPPLLVRLLFFLPWVLVILSGSGNAELHSDDDAGFISAVIYEKGLVFAKDLLIEQAVLSLTALSLPDITKTVKIPLIGTVSATASNITLLTVDVASSTVEPRASGVAIVASGATANLSMDWRYSYSTWLIEISDEGNAFVQVEGMEVGLTTHIENQKGTLELNVTECSCYVEDVSISLDGGASWFYQVFVNAFQNHIRSAVENAITEKITEGVLKLDSLLKTIPKEVNVDTVAALNVTFVNDPLFGNSSVEFDINGLFIPSDILALPSYLHNSIEPSVSCEGPLKMLVISLEESVFNSASVVYFQAGLMHWVVDKVPDQSLLNTASWKCLIPQLYKKYPNDTMQLNLTLTSPPAIRITPQEIYATIFLDMAVNVLDASETVSVACISMVVSASGAVEISGNNLAGSAELNDFNLKLKWSTVGNFDMSQIQGVMHVFLNTVFMPSVNAHLCKGFPLPIIHGFTLQNADILTSSSKLFVCSDVVYTRSNGLMQLS